jgi:uncharacterized protein with ParB-like and HNH nuclease domain
MQKYSFSHYPIEIILGWVTSGEIAISEIQRPFVWDASKISELVKILRRKSIK